MMCIIYRCSKKDEMYLYVPAENSKLEHLPEGLLRLTGQLVKVLELELTHERKLARADVREVLSALEQRGYFLQMPPNDLLSRDDNMLHDPSDSF